MALPPETAVALDRLQRFGTRLGLDRMRRLLAALGDPHEGLPTVLVAGTNGKGTVSALLASFAVAAHYRTGLYTSPHLEDVEERLRLDGVAIEGERLAGFLDRVLAAGAEALEEPPTYFEALTAAALLWFAEESVDLAVLEVGLGGRFDATNLVEPKVSVITSIDLDHREHLGDTLALVSREKAGIMRPGVSVVTVGTPPEVTEALAEEAARIGAVRVVAPERLAVEAVQRFRPFTSAAGPRQRVWLRDLQDLAEDGGEVEVYELALSGRHQADNLAIAVTAAGELRELGWEKLTVRALKKGARSCRWPGRLEEVELPDRPALPGGARVLLDVAHNPGGATSLAVALDDLGEPVDLVFGVLDDKDAAAMLALLAPKARRLTLTRPSGPRGRAAGELVPMVPGGSGTELEVVEEPAAAIDGALRGSEGRIVVVCGSLALVGEVRGALRRRHGVPEPAVQVKIN